MILILIIVLALQITFLIKSIIEKGVENKVLVFDVLSFILTVCLLLTFRNRMNIYAFYYEFGKTRVYFISILIALVAYFIVSFITLLVRFVFSRGNSTSSLCMLFAVPLLLIGTYLIYLELDNNFRYVPTPGVVLSIEKRQEYSSRSETNPDGIVYRPIVEFYRNGIKEIRAVDLSFFENAYLKVGDSVEIYIIEVKNEKTNDDFTIINPNPVYFESIYIPALILGAILLFISINTSSTYKKYSSQKVYNTVQQSAQEQLYYQEQGYDDSLQPYEFQGYYDAQQYDYEQPYYSDDDTDYTFDETL